MGERSAVGKISLQTFWSGAESAAMMFSVWKKTSLSFQLKRNSDAPERLRHVTDSKYSWLSRKKASKCARTVSGTPDCSAPDGVGLRLVGLVPDGVARDATPCAPEAAGCEPRT